MHCKLVRVSAEMLSSHLLALEILELGSMGLFLLVAGLEIGLGQKARKLRVHVARCYYYQYWKNVMMELLEMAMKVAELVVTALVVTLLALHLLELLQMVFAGFLVVLIPKNEE